MKAMDVSLGGPGTLRGIYLDVSQSVLRNVYTNADGVSPCWTGSTEIYSFRHDRVMLVDEMMRIAGFSSIVVPDSVSPRDLRRMLGAGMSLPCIGSILMALHVLQRELSS